MGTPGAAGAVPAKVLAAPGPDRAERPARSIAQDWLIEPAPAEAGQGPAAFNQAELNALPVDHR
jgi:hypothetical protein